MSGTASGPVVLTAVAAVVRTRQRPVAGSASVPELELPEFIACGFCVRVVGPEDPGTVGQELPV